MTKLKKKLKTPKGFMIIIAMIMFAIMSYWAIAAMKSNIQIITNTKNTNLYYRATDIANSMMEYAQYTVKKEHTSGYNLALECNYGKYKVGKPDNDQLCGDVMEGLLQGDGSADNVRMKLTIKGRSNDRIEEGTINEKFTGCPGGFTDGCYVIPFPGTGDASEKCKGYKPDFAIAENAKADKPINSNGGFVNDMGVECPDGEGVDCIKQIDYACNWNKLQFGSNLLDRAVIPFYYDDGNGNTVSPFKDGGNFVLRVRTPCKPKPCEGESCNSSKDPTICGDAQSGDRYKLDDENGDNAVTNDTVVQWQLTGKCGPVGKEDNEECGLIQYKDLSDLQRSSAITESRINNGDKLASPVDPFLKDYAVLYSYDIGSKRGMDTNTYSEINLPKISDKLMEWTKPILALFLGEKLKTATQGEFVPYLEYQVLTDEPIANPKIQMDVFVSVDDIGARKTMYKYEQKQLVDFAIQN